MLPCAWQRLIKTWYSTLVLQSHNCFGIVWLLRAFAIAAVITIAHAVPGRAACHDELLIGEDLRSTIYSANAGTGRTNDANEGQVRVDSICAIFDRLRGCWVPPPESQGRTGMEMSVRFAFKRNGEIIAPPRMTYATASTSAEIRTTYFKAVMAALHRCTPMHFTKGLASVIAGHPFAIRFVDDRAGLAQ